MQVRLLEVDDFIALAVFDISVPDVPLFGYCPVERLVSRGHFMELERNPVLQGFQGLPVAIAGDAAADRKKPRHRIHHVGRYAVPIGSVDGLSNPSVRDAIIGFSVQEFGILNQFLLSIFGFSYIG